MSSDRESSRRSFVSRLSSVALVGGLASAYGTLAAFMGRFVYPARPRQRSWMFLFDVDRLALGDAIDYRAPDGAAVTVARQSEGRGEEAFVALSGTCPHLGCRVHWEPQNDRFFCPCHNGTFDSDGTATGGPPLEAGQSLPRYPLKVERGLVYIEVPTESLSGQQARSAGRMIELRKISARPGFDPCLAAGRSCRSA